MNAFDLTGKRAIVTGAAQGLSKGMAEGLHEAGAAVVLIDIQEKVKDVAAEMGKEGAKVYALVADLEDRAALKKAFFDALDLLGGRIDILVNGAGIQRRHFSEEFPIDEWDSVIEVNSNAVWQLCQLAGREMIKQNYGKIINIASMLSFFGGYTVPAYAASKGAVAQFTKALCNEWAGKGINVNALAPGYMDTDMNIGINAKNNPTRYEEITKRIPAVRWGTPDDMKYVAVFLASPASQYINGAVIPIDGGYLCR